MNLCKSDLLNLYHLENQKIMMHVDTFCNSSYFFFFFSNCRYEKIQVV